MSGPKTLQYDLEQLKVREEEARRERERRQRQGERERLADAQAAAADAERRASRIERLAKDCGLAASLQRPPEGRRNDAGALELYTRQLEAEIARLESEMRGALAQKAQQLNAQALEKLGRPKSAAEVLEGFAIQAKAAAPAAVSNEPDTRRQRALRVLGRLANVAANALPPDMEALMAEMIGAPNALRAEALELELRLRVQRFNEEQARRARDVAEANELLASLPDAAACDAARQDLELVAAAMAPLDDALRGRVHEAIKTCEEELADARREQASRVLAETLKDLGYAVDGIENTLFVEGGVAHINKAEWGDYYVRLRVDPRDQTVNLNMVREREEGQSGDRHSGDVAAENSWCSGVPQLMKTLEARGLRMKVKRQLDAGAVPVQEVAPGAIPQSLKRATRQRTAEPKARTMKPQ